MTLTLRTRAALLAGRAAAWASRTAGKGGGWAIGGKVMLAVDPGAIAHLAAGHSTVLVSGTNGKTTTTSFVAAAARLAGGVATNLTGANLPSGVVSTLALAKRDGLASLVVLEVDEGHLPRAIAETRPIAAVLLNLSRDQLDRVGEVRRHADRWREALSTSPGTTVVANADDPLVVWAAQGASEILWVGTHLGWRSDATSCPACAGHIEWDAGGIWACDSCAFRRPPIDASLTDAGLVVGDACHSFELALPGWANRANAAMAAMAGSAFGVSIDQALESMRTTTGVEGRYERVVIGGIDVRLLLAKNPAGWNELFEVLSPAPTPLVVGINSRVVDGRDPSWLWDVPFERLRGRQVVATGERGRDLSVRLRYADVPHTFVADISQAVAAAGAAGQGIDLAANYSCFQQARQVAS